MRFISAARLGVARSVPATAEQGGEHSEECHDRQTDRQAARRSRRLGDDRSVDTGVAPAGALLGGRRPGCGVVVHHRVRVHDRRVVVRRLRRGVRRRRRGAVLLHLDVLEHQRLIAVSPDHAVQGRALGLDLDGLARLDIHGPVGLHLVEGAVVDSDCRVGLRVGHRHVPAGGRDGDVVQRLHRRRRRDRRSDVEALLRNGRRLVVLVGLVEDVAILVVDDDGEAVEPLVRNVDRLRVGGRVRPERQELLALVHGVDREGRVRREPGEVHAQRRRGRRRRRRGAVLRVDLVGRDGDGLLAVVEDLVQALLDGERDRHLGVVPDRLRGGVVLRLRHGDRVVVDPAHAVERDAGVVDRGGRRRRRGAVLRVDLVLGDRDRLLAVLEHLVDAVADGEGHGDLRVLPDGLASGVVLGARGVHRVVVDPTDTGEGEVGVRDLGRRRRRRGAVLRVDLVGRDGDGLLAVVEDLVQALLDGERDRHLGVVPDRLRGGVVLRLRHGDRVVVDPAHAVERDAGVVDRGGRRRRRRVVVAARTVRQVERSRPALVDVSRRGDDLAVKVLGGRVVRRPTGDLVEAHRDGLAVVERHRDAGRSLLLGSHLGDDEVPLGGVALVIAQGARVDVDRGRGVAGRERGAGTADTHEREQRGQHHCEQWYGPHATLLIASAHSSTPFFPFSQGVEMNRIVKCATRGRIC